MDGGMQTQTLKITNEAGHLQRHGAGRGTWYSVM